MTRSTWTKPPTWNAKKPRAQSTTRIIKIVSIMRTSFDCFTLVLLPIGIDRLEKLEEAKNYKAFFMPELFQQMLNRENCFLSRKRRNIGLLARQNRDSGKFSSFSAWEIEQLNRTNPVFQDISCQTIPAAYRESFSIFNDWRDHWQVFSSQGCAWRKGTVISPVPATKHSSIKASAAQALKAWYPHDKFAEWPGANHQAFKVKAMDWHITCLIYYKQGGQKWWIFK